MSILGEDVITGHVQQLKKSCSHPITSSWRIQRHRTLELITSADTVTLKVS